MSATGALIIIIIIIIITIRLLTLPTHKPTYLP